MNKDRKRLLYLALFGVMLRASIMLTPSEKAVRFLTRFLFVFGVLDFLRSPKNRLSTHVALLGTIANGVAINSNQGLMPVRRSELLKVKNIKRFKRYRDIEDLPSGSWIRGGHTSVVDDGDARFEPLIDRIPLIVKGRGGIASIGDLLLFLAGSIAIFEAVSLRRAKRQMV